jgi:hypothetical protein
VILQLVGFKKTSQYSWFARIFSVGAHNMGEGNLEYALSIETSDEGDTYNSIYFWRNYSTVSLQINNNLTDWFHIAICREGSTTRIFINGVMKESFYDTHNYTSNELNMVIGNEELIVSHSSFHGRLDGFQMVKGVALYTGDTFTPEMPVKIPETVVFLTGDELYYSEGEIINTDVIFSGIIVPYSNPVVIPPPSRNSKSLFSNNAMVFYKPNSMTSVPFGSVRNSRHVRYRT